MNLNLKKPIVFFDLEATGANVAKDRIIDISTLKIYPDGTKESWTSLVNPEMPISEEASEVNGIYDKDVADAPTFKEVGAKVFEIFDGSDIGGYNSNNYDIPMLMEEFHRVDIDFTIDDVETVDVFRIFTKMEPRDLVSAYKFYCGKTLVDAHSASADVMATYEVLLAQLDKYEDLDNDVSSLHKLSMDSRFVDMGRRMVKKKGVVYFNFGKFKGQPVKDVLKKDPGYYSWIMRSDFLRDTKAKLTAIKNELEG